MKNTNGFTLLEMIITVSIIGILSAVAVPNMIEWRNNAQYYGTGNQFASDLVVSKQQAIRSNQRVVTFFERDKYIIFLDDGDGGGIKNNEIRDGGEKIIRERVLPNSVWIDLGTSTFDNDKIVFNGRGTVPRLRDGEFIITRKDGEEWAIKVNRIGRVSFEKVIVETGE